MAEMIILAFVLFQLKHFVIDFVLQTPYQFQNKGTYGHPGGLLHAFLHGVGTAAVIAAVVHPINLTLLAMVFVADLLIHYHVDWAKVNINKAKGYGPNTHNQFWILLGIDQLAHQLTYALIIYFALI